LRPKTGKKRRPSRSWNSKPRRSWRTGTSSTQNRLI
jgi:hypothetical protein